MNSLARLLYCDIVVQMACITLFRKHTQNMYASGIKLFHHSEQCLFRNILTLIII